MGFTTSIFLFAFFPLCLLAYILCDRLSLLKKAGAFLNRIRAKDILLILFSLAFYMWACFDDVFRLCLYILLIYLAARWIEASRKKRLYINIYKEGQNDGSQTNKKLFLSLFPFIFAVACLVICLIYYKYSGFLTQLGNTLLGSSNEPQSILAPLGLSFITFSAISYLADIYRGNASAGSLIDCALYITFFPKVISGPIVLWKDFQAQIKQRKMSLNLSADGINRIIIGFAKKVLLADTFGACLTNIGAQGIDQLTAFGTLILYMLQIYYDFAGYSDIAIGLAKLFGFEFKENFDFPYRSKSISEFWRRWHISLGSWFRQYVYFPLGGSRAGLKKTLRNLAVVFALTGIWHGAGWNYLLWGFINGAMVILERVIQNKPFYKKTPNFIKYAFTMLIVMLFWQLFRFQSLKDTVNLLGTIIGINRPENIYYTWQYYFDAQMITFIIIGILGATVLGSPRLKAFYGKFSATKGGLIVQQTVLLLLFVLAVLFMINSTYSPFIYFQY